MQENGHLGTRTQLHKGWMKSENAFLLKKCPKGTWNVMFITHSSTSISLNCIFSSSSLLVKIPLTGLFKKKRGEKNLPHWNERVAPNACAATPFRQSQGHRHALAVCWQPCMNTKAWTWKSSPAFQLSFPRHCGKNTDYKKRKKKARQGSALWFEVK